MLDRLQKWYISNCNGDWEHSYGISIKTLDNPGWIVEVDLADTPMVAIPFASVELRASENDWIQCSVADDRFSGCGDSSKLNEIFGIFFNWVESNPWNTIGEDTQELLLNFANGILSYCEFVAMISPDISEALQKLLTYTVRNGSTYVSDENDKILTRDVDFNCVLSDSNALYDCVSSILRFYLPYVDIGKSYPLGIADTLKMLGLECLGGKQAYGIIKTVFLCLPDNMPQEGFLRKVNTRLHEVFMITNSLPIWVNEPEWPVINERPLRFVGQKTVGELTTYEFAQEDGEPYYVEQRSR